MKRLLRFLVLAVVALLLVAGAPPVPRAPTPARIHHALVKLGAPKPIAPAVAEAIAKYAKTPQEAAFLAAWGKLETGYSARIIAGECKAWECDRGSARGAYQLHRGAAGKDWDRMPGNIDIQTRAAARIARFAYGQCRTGDRVRGAFRVLAGLRCTGEPFRTEDERVATYARALELVTP